MSAVLRDRIIQRSAYVAVVGQGYVGLPLAVEFAKTGFTVVGLESDLDRVGRLNLGRSHIPDVDNNLLVRLIRTGRYSATADSAILAQCDVIIICVPTPLRKSKDPDISFVMAAAEQVALRLRRDQLIILESTTYPGTTEELLLPLFQAKELVVGADFHLAFSPERIDPGNVTFKVGQIPKLVGGITPSCGALAAALYQHIVPQVIQVSSATVAELAKLYENVFRNVNIALANEFAVMCRQLGIDTKEVIDAAATKPFGFMAFYPGPGIGGHCIPVDPLYLSWKMRLNGFEARFIQLADEINRAMPGHVIELVTEALNARCRSLNGARVLVLGVAYKRGVADTRESPALDIITRLQNKGANVSYADPYVPSVSVGGMTLKAVELDDVSLSQVDCVLIATDHQEFPYQRILERAALVVDPRNATYGLPAGPGQVIRL
jgi:UDP-N-acetyl-D-glucosamine dehydrogenase